MRPPKGAEVGCAEQRRTDSSVFTSKKRRDLAHLIYHVSGRRRKLQSSVITCGTIFMYLYELGIKVVACLSGASGSCVFMTCLLCVVSGEKNKLCVCVSGFVPPTETQLERGYVLLSQDPPQR